MKVIDFVKNYTKKLLKGVRKISDGHKENYANEWGFPDSSVGKESAISVGNPGWIPESGRSAREGIAIHSSTLGLPCGSAGKESTCNAGDLGSIPGLGRSPEERKGYPLQYSGLRIPCPWGHKESDMTKQLSLSLS